MTLYSGSNIRQKHPFELHGSCKHKHGFTFIELVMVIFIVAVMGSYLAMRVGTASGRSPEGLAEIIRCDILRMKGIAMKDNTTVKIKFESSEYSAEKGGTEYRDGHFPMRFAGVREFSRILIQPEASVKFNSRGQPVDEGGGLLSSNVDIQLRFVDNGPVEKTISVTAHTGLVKIR